MLATPHRRFEKERRVCDESLLQEPELRREDHDAVDHVDHQERLSRRRRDEPPSNWAERQQSAKSVVLLSMMFRRVCFRPLQTPRALRSRDQGGFCEEEPLRYMITREPERAEREGR